MDGNESGIQRWCSVGEVRMIVMRVLAGYTALIVFFCIVSCFIGVMLETNIAMNIWAIVLWAPILVFAVRFLTKGKGL